MGIIITPSITRDRPPQAQTGQPIRWNPRVRIIFADVDETVADVYTRATRGMAENLSRLLRAQRAMVLVSGGGRQSIKTRVTDQLQPAVRQNVIIADCSGAEAWGFSPHGRIRQKPIYSILSELLTAGQQRTWRDIMDEAVAKYGLTKYQTEPKSAFRERTSDPLHVMYDDRGAQITFEVINGVSLDAAPALTLNKTFVRAGLPQMEPAPDGTYDLRSALFAYCSSRLEEEHIEITPRLAGTFALDFALRGVDKSVAVQRVLASAQLAAILRRTSLNASFVEVWGDKFDQNRGGTDANFLKALPAGVRVIDFRKDEDPTGFPEGHEVTVWNGPRYLHEGCEDYLAEAV